MPAPRRTNSSGGTNNRPSTRRVAGSRRQQPAAAAPALAAPEARAAGAAPAEELAPADTGPATETEDAPIAETGAEPKTKPGPGPLPRPRITKSAKNSTARKEPTTQKTRTEKIRTDKIRTDKTRTAKTRTEELAETPGRTRINRLWFATAVLAAIAVAVGILATNWLGGYRDAQAREDAWQRALPAAKANVARLFSYDYRHIQADRNTVANLLTGQFRTDYLSSMDKLVIPQAPAKKFVLVSTTQSAGVSSVTEDGHQAVVIVFLNQSISNTDVKARTDLVRLRVTMTEVDGRWLVSEVKSV